DSLAAGVSAFGDRLVAEHGAGCERDLVVADLSGIDRCGSQESSRSVRKLLRSPIVNVVARWANKQPFIWDGVYESFQQVPVTGQGFASDTWLSEMEQYTRAALAQLDHDRGVIPKSVPQYHALLAAVVATFSAERPVRVLDFGGAMGIG